jgi:hypothetical protein
MHKVMHDMGTHEGFEWLDLKRAAEQKPLMRMTIMQRQKLTLRLGFDPLGNHIEAEAFSQDDNGPYDCGIMWIGQDVAHERLVDF